MKNTKHFELECVTIEIMEQSVAAVIFDFDGLVIDTESPAFEAWSAIYREHGQVLRLDLWVGCVGASEAGFDPVRHLAELLGRPVDGVALMADKELRKRAACDSLQPLPGVRERLSEARALGLKLAVASSSSRAWVEGHLRRLNLAATFDAMRTKDDVARVKPYPDLYLAAAAALGVAPERCLAIEDSLNGVRAARAAQMACLAVPGPITRALDFSLATARFDSLADVKLADFVG